MALASTTVYELNATATASNVNAGGFNTNNANFLTDLTTDTNTANTDSPVVSSASYNFVAGDVGAYVYIKSGTNWTPGFYKIASVASNKATLQAAIGEASQLNSSTARYTPNTVAGCATVGTPTNGTFGVAYQSLTTAIVNGLTDLTCTAASTTVTSASAPFTRVMVGNLIHLTALTGTGALVGWYEIVNYTDTSNVVLDRTPTNGVNNITAGTFYVGGALSLNSALDDDFFEILLGGNYVYMKNGTYATGENISMAAAPTSAWFLIGFNSVYGDDPSPFTTSSSAPLLSTANQFTLGVAAIVEFIRGSGTANPFFTLPNTGFMRRCRIVNTSTSGGRAALVIGVTSLTIESEFISQNGTAVSGTGNDARVVGNYIHDSSTGMTIATTRMNYLNNIVACCRVNAITCTSSTGYMQGNTLYGYPTPKASTIGISTAATQQLIYNNLITGFATGISGSSLVSSGQSTNNYFYNNTTDVTNFRQVGNSTGVNPSFAEIEILEGTTATCSTNTLTQTGAFSSANIVDNQSYVQIHSGTGATTGVYLITSHTSDTLTVNNTIGTNATADKSWSILTKTNFGIGTALKGLGWPNTFYGSNTVSYPDPGAVERQESASSAGTVIYFS